jgi:hypothetical protein
MSRSRHRGVVTGVEQGSNPERLSQKRHAGWHLQITLRQAGRYYDPHVWPALTHLLRQLQSVQAAGQTDVSEHNADGVVLRQMADRGVGTTSLKDGVAFFFQRAAHVKAHERLVLDNKDCLHVIPRCDADRV